jgi:hypothetical protein
MGRACPLCPRDSDINLFGNRERVVNLDAEIADLRTGSIKSFPILGGLHQRYARV